MLTRCPHCQTAFRVTPEQLKVRQGRVRCGACHAAFSALDSLADEAAIVIAQPHPPAEMPQEAAETSIAQTEIETETVPEPEQALAETPLTFDVEFSEPESVTVESDTLAVALPDAEIDVEEAGAVPEIEVPVPPEEPTGEDEGRVEESESRFSQDGAAMVEAALPPAPEPSAAGEPEDSPLPEAWTGLAVPPPPRRWPWRVGVALLLALMLGQLLFVFRVELAVLMPELRPTLAATCDLVGCILPHPRKPELLSIETSDLAPADGDRLLLTATLKNRAPFDLELPHLELTLTDTKDAAMVRKVLRPADYLPAGQSAETGFAARSEVSVRLTLESADVPAVGYRLYLFYP